MTAAILRPDGVQLAPDGTPGSVPVILVQPALSASQQYGTPSFVVAGDRSNVTVTYPVVAIPVTDLNRATLIQRAQAALDANATFLAIGSPTNPQVVAQVQTLTKECSALIRLALGLLDSTTGT